MAAKRASEKAKSRRVFGQARRLAKMVHAGLYARVSTNDQQTIPLQIRALREYAVRRGWAYCHAGATGRQRRLATATAREVTGGGRSPRNRRGAGVALRSLGPIGGGPARDTPGTGASWGRLRFPE